MKIITLFGFIFLLQCGSSKAQTLRLPPQSNYTRLIGYSHSQPDAFSFSANSAALSSVKKFSTGVYSERRYLLEELSLFSMALVLPSDAGNFGVSADVFGGKNYSEASCAFAYARTMAPGLSAGAQFHYYRISILAYGSAQALVGEAGLLYSPSEHWSVALNVYNPGGRALGAEQSERLPSVYSLGLGYDPSEKLSLCVDLRKEENQSIDMLAGLQYAFHQRFVARAGIASATSTAYLGLGFRLASMRIDATASLHPRAGLTPGLFLHYQPQEP
jgi:hypothetical protein